MHVYSYVPYCQRPIREELLIIRHHELSTDALIGRLNGEDCLLVVAGRTTNSDSSSTGSGSNSN